MERKEMPVFVKIDDYKDILEIIGLIKNKLRESRETMTKINQLKNKEDAELESWKNEVDEIEKKVAYIDNTLFEPENP